MCLDKLWYSFYGHEFCINQDEKDDLLTWAGGYNFVKMWISIQDSKVETLQWMTMVIVVGMDSVSYQCVLSLQNVSWESHQHVTWLMSRRSKRRSHSFWSKLRVFRNCFLGHLKLLSLAMLLWWWWQWSECCVTMIWQWDLCLPSLPWQETHIGHALPSPAQLSLLPQLPHMSQMSGCQNIQKCLLSSLDWWHV